MAVKVMMPKGSDTMTEGKVLKWLKKEGDAISTGDAVVEIETDKVDMEVEAMGTGVLRKVLVATGKSVPVGELLGVIASPTRTFPSFLKRRAPSGKSRSQEPAQAPAVVQTARRAPPPVRAHSFPGCPPHSAPHPPVHLAPTPPLLKPVRRILASPLAKRMAKDMGLELAEIAGIRPQRKDYPPGRGTPRRHAPPPSGHPRRLESPRPRVRLRPSAPAACPCARRP